MTLEFNALAVHFIDIHVARLQSANETTIRDARRRCLERGNG
jgi:hypothetical protein